jgi:hypothetical protein
MVTPVGSRKGASGGFEYRLTISFTGDTRDRVRRQAARRGIKPSVMLRCWIIEVLEREEKLDDDTFD